MDGWIKIPVLKSAVAPSLHGVLALDLLGKYSIHPVVDFLSVCRKQQQWCHTGGSCKHTLRLRSLPSFFISFSCSSWPQIGNNRQRTWRCLWPSAMHYDFPFLLVKNRAAMLRGLFFFLIIRSFFCTSRSPWSSIVFRQSRNGQAGPHHGNCDHQECLSVPTVMWQLCFCNFSSFQPIGVIHRGALTANLGAYFAET